MTVHVRYEGEGRPLLSCAAVRHRATRMLRALGAPDAELSILLCDDPFIETLNREYRAKAKPTDVLAFPLLDDTASPAGQHGPLMLGDIVISLPTANRQAEARSRRIDEEVTMLLAHGLLHLLGCDHRNRNEERRMVARTDMLRSAANRRSGRRT